MSWIYYTSVFKDYDVNWSEMSLPKNSEKCNGLSSNQTTSAVKNARKQATLAKFGFTKSRNYERNQFLCSYGKFRET